MFGEEARSAIAGFHVGPLVELEFGELVFVEGGKPENPVINPRSKARIN